MSEQDKPIGKPFSHLYIERGAPEKDSIRFRRRLGSFFDKYFSECKYEIEQLLEQECGVEVRYPADISRFFNEAELRDVLDFITHIFKYLSSRPAHYRVKHTDWKKFVERVFIEENLGYILDEKAGVHFFVDEEFERNRVSALSCLEEPKYAAVRNEFEKAHSKLDSDPVETKEAIKAIFEAVEILYKLIINAKGKDRLNGAGVRDKIKPIAQTIYFDDPTAIKAADLLLDGLCDWIEACHMYRHGQKVEEPNDPPIGLAVQIVSSGASYLRWLVEINKPEK